MGSLVGCLNMFTYTTLFLGSFVLAVVALFVFKVVTDTHKAKLKSKKRIEPFKRQPTHQFEAVPRMASAGTQFPPDDAGGNMSWGSAKLTPAMPDQRAIVETHGSGVAFPEHPAAQSQSVQKAKGCSLYDVGGTEAAVVNDSGDSSYKVSHHGPFDNLDEKDLT